MDGVQLSQGQNHFKEAVYFLPLSSQKCLVLILSTSKDETLSQPWSHFVVLNTEPWVGKPGHLLQGHCSICITVTFLHCCFIYLFNLQGSHYLGLAVYSNFSQHNLPLPKMVQDGITDLIYPLRRQNFCQPMASQGWHFAPTITVLDSESCM